MKYFNPVKLSFDVNSVEEIEKISINRKKRMVFCSKRFVGTEMFNRMFSGSNENFIFTEIEINPTVESIGRALNKAEEIDPDEIIAVGGGSVMDTAKVVRFGCVRKEFEINKLIDKQGVNEKSDEVLFIAIPTTHGSGSELTMWATVWDSRNKKKYSVSDESNYPDFAIYDYSLFRTLPLKVSVSTTLDALSHSFEALWNRNSNPVSDHFALESVKLIVENIGSLTDGIPDEIRAKFILASAYAGLAFSNTKTAAAHSISYPLTLRYGIPHGIACSMPLFSLLEINKKKMGSKFDRLLMKCEVKNSEELEKKIKDSIKNKIPFSLSEFGVDRKDIPGLVKESFTKERMANNVTDLTDYDVKKILEDIYEKKEDN